MINFLLGVGTGDSALHGIVSKMEGQTVIMMVAYIVQSVVHVTTPYPLLKVACHMVPK